MLPVQTIWEKIILIHPLMITVCVQYSHSQHSHVGLTDTSIIAWRSKHWPITYYHLLQRWLDCSESTKTKSWKKNNSIRWTMGRTWINELCASYSNFIFLTIKFSGCGQWDRGWQRWHLLLQWNQVLFWFFVKKKHC